MNNTPTYIKSLIIPQGKKPPASRKVWSIDLEKVWIPFFHATNVQGDTAIPAEALGAPLRLALNKDGAVRFSDSGKPVIRVVKDVSDVVRLVRQNFEAGLISYTNGVATENEEAYNAHVAKCVEAGKPIIAYDTAKLLDAQLKREAEAKAKMEAEKEKPAEQPATPTPQAEKTPEMATAS